MCCHGKPLTFVTFLDEVGCIFFSWSTNNILVLISFKREIDHQYAATTEFMYISLKAYSTSSNSKHRRYGRVKDLLYKTSSMRVYLAALIFNFTDCEFVFAVKLFKYLIIGLLQSRASIAIIFCSFAVLDWLSISTKIPIVAFGLEGSSQESSSTLAFSSQGICIN